MPHDDEAHESADKLEGPPPSYTPSDEDHWRHQMYTPTDADRAECAKAEIPDDEAIVAGFLLNNPFVYNVPDKTEIFRLADLVSKDPLSDPMPVDAYLHLKIAKPPFQWHQELAHPASIDPMGMYHELHFTVRLQVMIVDMVLARIKVIHGSRTDDSEEIVFEGTECPGPALHGNIRVVRVTVRRKDYATFEVLSETRYPVKSWF